MRRLRARWTCHSLDPPSAGGPAGKLTAIELGKAGEQRQVGRRPPEVESEGAGLAARLRPARSAGGPPGRRQQAPHPLARLPGGGSGPSWPSRDVSSSQSITGTAAPRRSGRVGGRRRRPPRRRGAGAPPRPRRAPGTASSAPRPRGAFAVPSGAPEAGEEAAQRRVAVPLAPAGPAGVRPAQDRGLGSVVGGAGEPAGARQALDRDPARAEAGLRQIPKQVCQ